jgi:hypothetical protein
VGVDAAADYLALDSHRFPWLTRLGVREADDGSMGIDLELEFRDEGRGRLIVRCGGVRELEFKQPWTTDMRFHSLDITDVRDRQLEGIAYFVVDIEQDWLSFNAASLSTSVNVD